MFRRESLQAAVTRTGPFDERKALRRSTDPFHGRPSVAVNGGEDFTEAVSSYRHWRCCT